MIRVMTACGIFRMVVPACMRKNGVCRPHAREWWLRTRCPDAGRLSDLGTARRAGWGVVGAGSCTVHAGRVVIVHAVEVMLKADTPAKKKWSNLHKN